MFICYRRAELIQYHLAYFPSPICFSIVCTAALQEFSFYPTLRFRRSVIMLLLFLVVDLVLQFHHSWLLIDYTYLFQFICDLLCYPHNFLQITS